MIGHLPPYYDLYAKEVFTRWFQPALQKNMGSSSQRNMGLKIKEKSWNHKL